MCCLTHFSCSMYQGSHIQNKSEYRAGVLARAEVNDELKQVLTRRSKEKQATSTPSPKAPTTNLSMNLWGFITELRWVATFMGVGVPFFTGHTWESLYQAWIRASLQPHRWNTHGGGGGTGEKERMRKRKRDSRTHTCLFFNRLYTLAPPPGHVPLRQSCLQQVVRSDWVLRWESHSAPQSSVRGISTHQALLG